MVTVIRKFFSKPVVEAEVLPANVSVVISNGVKTYYLGGRAILLRAPTFKIEDGKLRSITGRCAGKLDNGSQCERVREIANSDAFQVSLCRDCAKLKQSRKVSEYRRQQRKENRTKDG